MKFNLDPKIFLAGAAISIIAIFPFDVSFYTFVRIAICLSAIYGVYFFNQKENGLWILFAAMAILYNPIKPVYLREKELWQVVNTITALIFLYSFRVSNSLEKNDILCFYVGRIICLGGCFCTFVLFIVLINEGMFDSVDYLWMGALIIGISITATVICSKLWNYFFLNNSAFWISEIEHKNK